MDRGFTKTDLVAEARSAGFVVDEKLIDRWVSAGLLDQAQPRGRGRGRGVGRYWPESQRNALVSLLDKHRTARYLRTLTNVPVLVWVIWGEDEVPLRQVRRALETYAQITPGKRPFRGRAWARELVTKIAIPSATGYQRQALADTLLRNLESDTIDDPDLDRLFAIVVGPEAPAAQADGPRMLSIIRAQWAARARFSELKDGHFRWARAFMLASQADYSVTSPLLAADPRFGHLHAPFDLQHIANEACHSILLILGLGLTFPPAPPMREELRLDPWLAGRAQLRTGVVPHSQLDANSRWRISGLGISIAITLDPAETVG